MGVTPSRELKVETVSASSLKLEEMQKAHPRVIALMESTQGQCQLPWADYVIDSWYTPAIVRYMYAKPLSTTKLADKDITALASKQVDPIMLKRLKSVMKPGEKYFVRTSMCSTKVGIFPRPASNEKEVLDQVMSCQRCLDAFGKVPEVEHAIWLFEWMADCDIKREFRVFIKNKKGVYACFRVELSAKELARRVSFLSLLSLFLKLGFWVTTSILSCLINLLVDDETLRKKISHH